MDRTDIQEAFKQAGITRLLKDVDALVRPSIRLLTRPVEESTLPLGASKLGGVPDLPAGTSWPEWKGLPQSFIGQLQLADVQAYDVEHALPTQGMLWFFYDARQETYGMEPEDAGGWQVRYSETFTQLQRTQFPEKLPQSSRFRSCALKYVEELTLPQDPKLERPTLDWTDEEVETYENMLADLMQADKYGSIRHRLLGHPDTLQDDMRLQCQLATHGVSDVDDPRVAELAKGNQNWHLLLQVDSDHQAGMRWSSNGMLYYWMQKVQNGNLQDQARHFDNTWLVLQSE